MTESQEHLDRLIGEAAGLSYTSAPKPAFAVLKRNPETAAAIQRILGLPDDRWSDIQITLTLDGVATATVDLLLSPQQLVDLVEWTQT